MSENAPPIKNQTYQPVSPELIDGDQSVFHSFQADPDFQKIHSSSVKADLSFEAAPDCVSIATHMGKIAGLPPLERVVASSPKSRLMIFSLDAPNASPPGPRVFGLTTDPNVKIDEAIRFVQPLL